MLPIHHAPTEGQRRYNKAQEGTWKDIQHLFGIMQARLWNLRRESELWSVENLVCVTEVCVIFQDLLVRMTQSGAFREEVMEDDTKVDLVTQFLDEEEARHAECGEEVAKRHAEDSMEEENQGGFTEMEQVEAMIDELDVMHDIITSEDEHYALRNDLIDMLTSAAGRWGH